MTNPIPPGTNPAFFPPSQIPVNSLAGVSPQTPTPPKVAQTGQSAISRTLDTKRKEEPISYDVKQGSKNAKIAELSPLNAFPPPVLTTVFQYLDFGSLDQCAKIYQKEWGKCIQNASLMQLKLHPNYFGKEDWEKYYGLIGKAPPLPRDIQKILSSECPYWPGQTVLETHLLVLIPKTANGKPFTLSTLGELIQKPQGGGHVTKYGYYDEAVQKVHGSASSSKSYWVLMTKDALPSSRGKGKSFAEQRALLKSSYTAPGVLEAATAILLHHVKTGEKLYPNMPCTYTRCKENAGGYRVVVGSFGSSGLCVYHYGDYRCGLSGLRKFF